METQFETQRQIILNHLRSGKKISTWEAIQRYHITRLSRYIEILRKEGFNIVDRWEQSPTSRFKVFWLNES